MADLYRGKWHIYYDRKPYVAGHDWSFYHDDYDGAPDANDNRCGTAASYDAAVEEIDFIEEDL